MNAALIAVLAVLAAKRTLAERLIAEGATAPEHAQPLAEDDLRLADALVREGVLREAAPGRYYVDEAAFSAWSRADNDPRQARKVMVGLGVGLLVLLAFSLLLLVLTR